MASVQQRERAVPTSDSLRALRGRLLWFVDDPDSAGEAAHRYVEDGLLIIENGLVRAAGEASALLPTLPGGVDVVDREFHDGRISRGMFDRDHGRCSIRRWQARQVTSLGWPAGLKRVAQLG